MIPFDEALAKGGPLLPAWDDDDVRSRRLRLYSVGASGAALVATTDVPPPGREAMTDRLLDLGLRIGGTYGTMPFVWVMDGRGCTIWSDQGVVADGTFDLLTIGRQKVPLGDVTKVISFIDPKDRGHRGVRLEVRGAHYVTVVEEHDRTPHLDPTYGHDNELMDSGWIFYIGTYLASWLSLTHLEPFHGLANEQDLVVRRAALALAAEAGKAPEAGPFDELQRQVGRIPPSGGLLLRFAANPLKPDLRFLEVQASTPSGKSRSGRWLRQGSNARIAGFLRDVATPRAILKTMHDLLQGLKRDDYA